MTDAWTSQVDGPPPTTPAGWYPDVRDPLIQRWWDGAGWTPATRPVTSSTPPTATATPMGQAPEAEPKIAVSQMDPFFAFGPIGALTLVVLATILILPQAMGDGGRTLALALTMGIGVPFALLLALRGYLAMRYSRFTLTNRRVIVRTGLLARRTHELLLHKVESIKVKQSLFGRLVGYGTVVVRGTGGVIMPMVGMRDARGFQRLIQQQVDEASGHR